MRGPLIIESLTALFLVITLVLALHPRVKFEVVKESARLLSTVGVILAWFAGDWNSFFVNVAFMFTAFAVLR